MVGMYSRRLLASLVVFVVLVGGCRSETTPPADTAACALRVDPGPGLFAATTVSIAVTVEPAADTAVRYDLTTRAVVDAPEALPSQPTPASAPAVSVPLPTDGGLVLSEGYHVLALRRPCDGAWIAYTYLVDAQAPDVALMPPSGSYATPLTVSISTAEPYATMYARVRPAGSDTTPPAFPVTAPFEIFESGAWVVEAWAIDRTGNRSEPVTAAYTLAADLPRLISWYTAVGSSLLSRLPLMRATYDRPMDTSVYQVDDLVTFPDGPTAPYDGVAFWVDEYTVDMLPLARLPEGARAIMAPGPMSDAVGRRVDSTLTAEIQACRDCDGIPAQLLRVEGWPEMSAAATEWTVDLVFDRAILPDDFNRLFLISRSVISSLAPCLGAICDGWRLTAASAPLPSTTLTLSVEAARLATAETTQISLNHRDDRRPLMAAVRAAGATTTATAPAWITAEVAPRGHAIAIDLLSNHPVMAASVTAALTVNGLPAAFRTERLGPSAGQRLRLLPATAWPAGAALSLQVSAGTVDAWGRTLPSFSWSGTAPAAPAAWLLQWNVPLQPRLPLSSGALLAAAVVDPPAAGVANLSVVDAETGAPIDALEVFALPIGGRKNDAGVARLELRSTDWAPMISHARRVVVSGDLLAAGTAPLAGGSFVFEFFIGTPDRPYADPVSPAGLWNGIVGLPFAAAPDALTWRLYGAAGGAANLSIAPAVSGWESWAFDGGTGSAESRVFQAAAAPLTLTTYSGPVTAWLTAGALQIQRPAWVLAGSGFGTIGYPADGTAFASATTIDAAWSASSVTGATGWALILEEITSGTTLRGFWRLPDSARTWPLYPADFGAGSGTRQFRLNLLRLREPGDRADRPDIPLEGFLAGNPVTFTVDF